MIIMKFGGTSLQDTEAVSRSLQAVETRLPERPCVVLSAMGKTTNKLLDVARLAQKGDIQEAQKICLELGEYHSEVSRDLLTGERLAETDRKLRGYLEEISKTIQGLYLLGECTPRSQDAITSFGERMSSLVFSQALAEQGHPAALLDSRDLICTDNDFTRASVFEELSFSRIREEVAPRMKSGEVAVLQGFIGSTKEGITTTIGRGGSDYTASLIGAALEVRDVQIWTDVPGILTANPCIVAHVYKIKAISFHEASELAYFGAKVLHPSTLLPAIARNIPVHICDSSRIDEMGTLINADTIPSKTPVKSVACKKGITLLNIYSTRMLLAYGFLRGIFDVFDRHKTVVDVVATSEVSVSLTIDSTTKLEPLVKDLQVFGKVDVEPNVAIICVVGDNLRSTPGIPARIFNSVETINVLMISQGASHINVTFIVEEDRMKDCVCRLHEEFFAQPDPDLFEAVGVKN